MKSQKQKTPVVRFPITLGERYARELGVARARLSQQRDRAHLEGLAAMFGVDLADPDQFRICQGWAANLKKVAAEIKADLSNPEDLKVCQELAAA